MSEVSANRVLDTALIHVYRKRKSEMYNSDIWPLKLYWHQHRKNIRNLLLAGEYRLQEVVGFKGMDGKYYTRWSSRDAVVLKAMSLVFGELVGSQIKNCYHLKGMGGLKGAIKSVVAEIKGYTYVLKSDVADFYGSMDHGILLERCQKIIKDTRIINLFHQYMERLEVVNGQYYHINQGIPKGCPLSPLMGALILKSLDRIAKGECVYIKYMDDWLVLAKTRWQLRRIVKEMYRVMKELKFRLAMDKTYIGKIHKGFDFLGYRFGSQGVVGLAAKTIRNFLEKTARLYEQSATDHRISCYINKWCGWLDTVGY